MDVTIGEKKPLDDSDVLIRLGYFDGSPNYHYDRDAVYSGQLTGAESAMPWIEGLKERKAGKKVFDPATLRDGELFEIAEMGISSAITTCADSDEWLYGSAEADENFMRRLRNAQTALETLKARFTTNA